MAVGGRHIRHDWKTFVDWEQNSVRTCCGSTTKRHLAGIPGVTEQPEIVEAKDKKLWGWCMACVRSCWWELHQMEKEEIIPELKVMYERVTNTLVGQITWEKEREEKRRELWKAKEAARKAKEANHGTLLRVPHND